MTSEEFLTTAYTQALSSGHIFPAYACCEAGLESGWGGSKLAVEANNLFGQKQSHPPLPNTSTLVLPTKEFINGQWTVVDANWVKFDSWALSFAARMALLRRLAPSYPHYAAALAAKTGEEFITEVSKNWSTDPQRAQKVLTVYHQHESIFPQ